MNTRKLEFWILLADLVWIVLAFLSADLLRYGLPGRGAIGLRFARFCRLLLQPAAVGWLSRWLCTWTASVVAGECRRCSPSFSWGCLARLPSLLCWGISAGIMFPGSPLLISCFCWERVLPAFVVAREH